MYEQRILVVANETVTSDTLREAVGARVRGRPARVLVVAPALNGRIRHWISDEDAARRAARERLLAFLSGLAGDGIDANGVVGDADPMLAIADALAVFRADELVIATHPEGKSHWLARDLVARARRGFGLPVLHVVVGGAPARTEPAAAA